MGKPHIYLTRGIYIEKLSEKKKIRLTKIKPGGRLFNVRLKPVWDQLSSVLNTSCISSRARSCHNIKSRKCNRKVSLEENGLIKSFDKFKPKCEEIHAMEIMSKEENPRRKLLAFMVYSRFLKKAWIKRKEVCEIQEVYIQSSNAQINNLKMQIFSLKSLLASDEKIMKSSLREITSLKLLLAHLQEQYTDVKAEKENLERKTENLQEELSKLLMEFRNAKNEYILAKSEVLAFEVQLEKEREKIANLKSDNRSLLSKIEKELPSSSSGSTKNEQPIIHNNLDPN